MTTLLPYRAEVRGLHTLETVKHDIESSENHRARAFFMLSYFRLTDEARAYINQLVKREG